ncbi:flippase [Azospirillum canadense]|uniref:flippase n=1 Tax=Azospirillum canadense TaxID=403962 RepID=UPI0022270E72|nr:flippase [Azospirillum canadense]MCW2235859.1 O-antigen/teichoic acid export membrane protein [Azospirillum canadense]
MTAATNAATNAGRRIFLNIRALGLARVATLMSGLVTTAWTARALGPESFGVLGFGTSMLAYAALFVNLGLSTYAVREISRAKDNLGDKAAELADHVLTLRSLLALVVGAIYAAFVLTLDKPGLVKAVLLVQAIQLLGNALLLDFVYQATERMSVIATREIGTGFGITIAMLALVHGPDDVAIAAAITGGSFVINAVLMLVRFSRDFRPPRPRVDLKVWAAILKVSAPMAVSVFAWALFSHLDLVMLGFLVPQHDVGLYTAVTKLLVLALTAGNIVLSAFMPQLAAAYGDPERMRERMRDYATTILGIGGLIAAGGVTLAPAILGVVYGPAYADAADSLRLIMISVAVVHVNLALGNPLLVWHRQTGYMTAILVGGVTNAALNCVLIPRWGIEGSAVATIVAELTAMAGLAWQHRRAVGDLPLDIIARAALCGLLAVAATLGLTHALPDLLAPKSPLLAVLVGGLLLTAVYVPAVLITGLVRPSRLRRLMTAVA